MDPLVQAASFNPNYSMQQQPEAPLYDAAANSVFPDGPPTKVPSKAWLANYMSSPIYKQRLLSQGLNTLPDVNNVVNAHIMHINGGHSRAWTQSEGIKQKLSEDNQYPIDPGRSNINIDRPEINSYKEVFGRTETPEEVLAHELSHVSRRITPQEQLLIASKNQTPQAKVLLDRYNESQNKGRDFSDYLFKHDDSGITHDLRPDENKADLDALRFMMFKKGIYDTSKRNMTIDDFNKAKSDKDIGESLEFNRLMKNFKPADLILLNNTIAANKGGSSNDKQV